MTRIFQQSPGLSSMTANTQWAQRPEDQRFWDLQELVQATERYRNQTEIRNLDLTSLQVEAVDNNGLQLTADVVDAPMTPSWWAFQQLCSTVRAPSRYLRELPAERAADLLNYGISRLRRQQDPGDLLDLPGADTETPPVPQDRPSQLIFRSGDNTLLGLTSQKYGRIWNNDIARRLADTATALGFRVPPARPAVAGGRTRIATAADVEGINPSGLGIPVQEGDVIGPSGLYASLHDLFVFMVDPSARLENGGLARGFILKNSEVGAGGFVLWAFLLEAVCGNHIVHGLRQLLEVRVVHIGLAEDRAFDKLQTKLTEYARSDTQPVADLLQAAAHFSLGTDKKSTVDRVYGDRRIGMNKYMAEQSYDIAAAETSFDPNSARGMAAGATRLSQRLVGGYADRRTELDRISGRLLHMAINN